ncbi:MAG: kynureninase [Verrucomicrobia bacterium]|nr:kynureninase [Verrucomicrobiota bacterium]
MSADPAALDAADPLARFRADFFLPAGKIYLDGNSLGPLSRRAEAHLARVVTEWRTLGIDGWTEAAPPWLTLAETAAGKLAPLLGAAPDEVCVTGQTTANLHQLLATLFEPAHPTRRVILGDALNFASDAYAVQSHLRLRGLDPASHLRVVPSRDGRILRLDDLLAAFSEPDVQLAVLPSVVFTSGQLLDVATVTRKARERGLLIGWDCSHSIGAVPHTLGGEAGPDFAFWCHYKWLNAGPGAVGGLFLHHRHHARAPGLAGWWGVRADRRFAMSPYHEPAPGAAALHIGTPHLLSLAPLIGSLELVAEAGGMCALRAKSLALTDFLLAAIDRELAPLGIAVATPRGALARGGHLSLAHPDAWRICQALKSAGVISDFRAPDLVRLAPSPFYTSFADCAEAVARLKDILLTRAYEKFPSAPGLVP